MHRLANLSTPARAALQAAAVLGENIPFPQWVKTSDISPLDLAGLREELVTKHWLQNSPQGYSFVHDLIRTTVYDNIKPTDRRNYHGRAVQAYLELEPDNARVLAFHLDQAGQAAEAAALYRRAGEQDRERFAFQEAQAAFDQALALMARTPTTERIEIELALARVCEITGDRIRQGPALDEAIAGARQFGNETLLLEALLVLGRAASRTGHFQEAESYLSTALALAQNLQDRSRETEAILFIGDLSGMQGKWADARGHYSKALKIAKAISDLAQRPVRCEASPSRPASWATRKNRQSGSKSVWQLTGNSETG